MASDVEHSPESSVEPVSTDTPSTPATSPAPAESASTVASAAVAPLPGVAPALSGSRQDVVAPALPAPTGEPPAALEATADVEPSTFTNVLGFLALMVITAVGLWYRFENLGLKPLHHDEGVNGWFILRLLDEGKYNYNPKNYHGPLLYVLNTIPVIFAGATDTALRFMPSLFGALAIPSMLLFRRHIGWIGVLLAAAYIAIAPLEVYFSRTAIHEIYNFTFNLTLVGALVAWTTTRRQIWLTVAACSLICLFGTKETTVITLAAMGPALMLAVLLGKGPLPEPGMAVEQRGLIGHVLGTLWYLGAVVMNEKEAIKKAAIIAFGLWVFLFSFWLNPVGLGSFFAAFFLWGDTGVEGKGHQKVWSYFLTHLLWPYYRPVLIFGLLGLVWGMVRRQRLAIFTLGWFVAATTAYAIIPYKTPWCVLSFSTPLFIGMGVLGKNAIDGILRGNVALKLLGVTSLVASMALTVPYAIPLGPKYDELVKPFATRETPTPERQLARFFLPFEDSWTINFVEYDVKGHPFIYVQNVREYLDMIHDIEGLIQTAQLEGDTKKPTIVMIDAKNPMRWYLRKTGTQHWPRKFEDDAKKKVANNPDLVVVSKEFANDVKAALKDKPYILRRYAERPGRKIDVYIKQDLWTAYQAAATAGKVPTISPTPQEKSYSDRRTTEMKEVWSKKAMN